MNVNTAETVSCSQDDENTQSPTSLGEVLFNNLRKHQDKVLLYLADSNETVTYAQHVECCIRAAIKLKQEGIGRNDIISSCTHNHKYNWVPFIATQLLGAISANFDPDLSHLDTIHLLKLIQPKIMFVSPESLTFMEGCLKESKINTKIVIFGKHDKYSQFSEYLESSEEEKSFKPISIEDSKDTAVILFSSGTTGLPKGICISHFALVDETINDKRISKFTEGNQTVMLLYTTLYWITAVSSLIKVIAGGSATVVCSKFHPGNTWKLIEKYKVNVLFLAPYHATDFVLQCQAATDVSSLRIFATGACLAPKSLLQNLKAVLPKVLILQGYGQTETGGMTTMFDITDPEQLKMLQEKPQSCGKIRSGVTWKIVNPDTEEILGPNQNGEMRIKSPYLMNGYYKMDSSTEYDSEGYFKSGDILYCDEDGCFYVVDRIKEMFKYRGWHILPAILEDIIIAHEAVKDAVVIGIPHEVDGDHPMALVVLADGYEGTSAKDIELFVEGKVSDNQKLRAGVKFITEVLRTTTGKIRRNEMRKMILAGKI